MSTQTPATYAPMRLFTSPSAFPLLLDEAKTLFAAAARVDRPAALAGVPLTLWLGFATLLADGIRRRNV